MAQVTTSEKISLLTLRNDETLMGYYEPLNFSKSDKWASDIVRSYCSDRCVNEE